VKECSRDAAHDYSSIDSIVRAAKEIGISSRGADYDQRSPFASPEAKSAIVALFAKAPPVLAEVRYPKMATSPDWHLCEDDEELDCAARADWTGVEYIFIGVWDLVNRKEAICLKR